MNPADTRRLIHASTALVLLIPAWAGWWVLRVTLIVAAALWTGFEVARLRSSGFGDRLAAQVPVFRSDESHRLSGAWYLWLAYAGVSWLPPVPAVAGILVGALADPAASMVGSRWRNRTPREGSGKTWPGTVAAIVVSFLVLGLVPVGVGVRVVASLLAAGGERWCGPVNDNLVVGPVAAVAVLILS